MKNQRAFTIQLLFLGFLALRCDFPYSPSKQFPPQGTEVVRVEGGATIYLINKGKQICNPSVSQDDANFPACMLWLGFNEDLIVNVPSEWKEIYNTSNVEMHDRITISDTSNTVRWFLKKGIDIPVHGEIQDPEWSNHPGYIACLGENEQRKWDGYVVRIHDKKHLKFCSSTMGNTSTPFVWLPESAPAPNGIAENPVYDSNGFVDKASISAFFGTTNVKIAYSKRENGATLYYIDYSKDNPGPVRLSKPREKESWKAESPLISPTGDCVVYNCFSTPTNYSAYIQKLDPRSNAVLIDDNASDPHWWRHPFDSSKLFLIYAKIPDAHIVPQRLEEPSLQEDGSAGQTVKRPVAIYGGDLPLHASIELGDPEILLSLPFKGGLSKKGDFLATGLRYAYLAKLPM